MHSCQCTQLRVWSFLIGINFQNTWRSDRIWAFKSWVLKNRELRKTNIFRIIRKYFKTAYALNFKYLKTN